MSRASASSGRFSLTRELTLGLAVYSLYLLVRSLVLRDRGRERARKNAERIVVLERRLGLALEPSLQRAVLRFPSVVHGLNLGYGLFNVGLTLGWLVYLYRRGDPAYHRFRRACVFAHVGAQPFFHRFPTEPPRALDGFVDTLAHISGFDLEHDLVVRFYNPVAAMPSLHVAFAVVTGSELTRRAESPVARAAAAVYPPIVSLVVVATGNHYVLDTVGGAALGAVARRLA